MTLLLLAALFGAGALLVVQGYPSGAPPQACDSLTPNHNAVAQTGPSPYTIAVTSSYYSSGALVTVTITGSGYKGFLLQARRLRDNAVVGTFLGPMAPETRYQIRNCNAPVNGNYVTHTDNSTKSNLIFTWTAPNNDEGQIVIRGSVVQSKLVWWGVLNSTQLTFQPVSTTLNPTTTKRVNSATSVNAVFTTILVPVLYLFGCLLRFY